MRSTRSRRGAENRTELAIAVSFTALVVGSIALLAATGQTPVGSTITGQPVAETAWYFRTDYFFLAFVGLPIGVFWVAHRLYTAGPGRPAGRSRSRR